MPNPNETRQTAMVNLQFLQRSQMTGADVDNYMAVRNWLTMIANGNLEVVTPAPAQPPAASPPSQNPAQPDEAAAAQ